MTQNVHVQRLTNKTVRGAGELALLVTDTAEDQSSVLSAHAGQLLTKPPVTDSSPRGGSDVFFWALWTLSWQTLTETHHKK